MKKISKNLKLYHVGIDHTCKRKGTFNSSSKVDVFGEPLHYIFGEEKSEIINSVLAFLKSFNKTCLSHHFIFKTERLNNYSFKFLVTLLNLENQEQEPIIVFLQEE